MEGSNYICTVCYNFTVSKGEHGDYCCSVCGILSQTVREDYVEDEGGIYSKSYTRRNASPSQNPAPQTQEEEDANALLEALRSIPRTAGAHGEVKGDEELEDALDVSESEGDVEWRNPNDPSDIEVYAKAMSKIYAEGVQILIQLQMEALVSKLGLSALVCGVAGEIWLRFLAKSRVFSDEWARDVLSAHGCLSDIMNADTPARKRKQKWKLEGYPNINLQGKRVYLILKDALRDRIPLSTSLVVSFLSCHIAREPMLPTDIIKWAVEGKLPYIAAFVDIEKRLLVSRRSLPVDVKFLMRPNQMVGSRQLECMSGLFAKRIGLKLPHVNYLSISCRFLSELSIPIKKLFDAVCRFHAWTTIPGLWISADFTALPTRVYVMSVLIIVFRVLYNINGQGYWEETINGNAVKRDEDSVEASKLLHHLNSWYQRNSDELEFEKDLQTYLKYCQNVVFAGCKMPFDEETLASRLSKLYETSQLEDVEKCNGAEENGCHDPIILNLKDVTIPENDRKKTKRSVKESIKTCTQKDHLETSSTIEKQNEKIKIDVRLRRIISEMQEDGFRYLPPVDDASQAYFRYRKTKCNGSIEHIVHADYYILLRACAKAIKVKACTLHICVLNIEKQLDLIEDLIRETLKKEGYGM